MKPGDSYVVCKEQEDPSCNYKKKFLSIMQHLKYYDLAMGPMTGWELEEFCGKENV